MSDALTVLSTTAMKTSLDAIGPAFEAESGIRLSVSYAPSARLTRQIGEGLRGDVALITAPQLDTLTAEGHIVAGSRVDVATSRIGLAVQAGAPRPDIATVEGVRQALLAAKSIGTSNPVGGGVSGRHLKEVFERLGILETINDRLLFGPGGPEGLIGLFLKRGEVEIGLQQMSELMAVPGIDVVGPLPDAIQAVTIFTTGLFAGSTQADAARRFAAALRSPAAQAVLREKGMEPA